VLADKAYSSRAIRAHLRTRGIDSVIPEPDDQKAHRKRIGSSGGRPVTYDRTAYRGRNVIERAFNGFKHWRGLATRYDKHAIVYRGGLVLAAVLLWLTDLGDTSLAQPVSSPSGRDHRRGGHDRDHEQPEREQVRDRAPQADGPDDEQLGVDQPQGEGDAGDGGGQARCVPERRRGPPRRGQA